MNYSKKFIAVYTVLGLFTASTPALAVVPGTLPVELKTPGTERNLVLPSVADRSPVISLGTGIDPVSGKKVDGASFRLGATSVHTSHSRVPGIDRVSSNSVGIYE